LKSAPYATRIFLVSNQHAHLKPVKGKDGLEIRNCHLSESFEELKETGMFKHLQDTARAYSPLGPAYYSLGDENALGYPYFDVCFCEKCQDAFRKYLKSIYNSLDALNKEWNTNYKRWEEVKPITLINAYKLKRYPQWLDHRLFMDKSFGDYHISCVKAIKEIDKKAKVGLEGAVYPYRTGTGFNWYQMLPHFHFFGPYRNPIETHAALSFLPSNSIICAWFGSYRGETHEQYMRYFPWAILFEGMNACAWWPSGVTGSKGLGGAAAYTPDYTPLLHFKQACEEIKEIKSGIGKLLISSERVISPIGVYYSNSCLHASTIRPKETIWENSLLDFNYILRDCGYEYKYLSPGDIMNNKLKNFKVLILPYSQAISLKEVKKIKDFVRNGGILIADFVPGIMDEHGKILKENSLLDVFGKFSRLNIHPYGKGMAVYLLDYTKGYKDKRKKGRGKGICSGFKRIIQELAKIEPFAEVENQEGNIRQDIDVSLFKNGRSFYLTTIRNVSSTSSVKTSGPEGGTVGGAVESGDSPLVKIKLPHSFYIYDVRENKFLGHTDEFKTSLLPSQAKVFALLPSKIDKIEIKLNKKEYKKGEEIKFSVNISPRKIKNSVVRIKIISPDGKIIPYYCQNLIYKNNKLNGIIPLSLNEISGTYKIIAEEIVSGLKVKRNFNIKEKK